MEQYKKWTNEQGQLWVNVASSIYTIKDFVNFDNNPYLYAYPLYRLCKPILKPILPAFPLKILNGIEDAKRVAPLLKHDCRKPLPFPKQSVDHILCSHFLEHVYPDEADNILHDFLRILKVGGTIDLRVPDIAAYVRQYLQDAEAGNVSAADKLIIETVLTFNKHRSFRSRMLECFGWCGLQHRWMYDAASFQAKIKSCFGDTIVFLTDNTTPSRIFRPEIPDGDVRLYIQKITS